MSSSKKFIIWDDGSFSGCLFYLVELAQYFSLYHGKENVYFKTSEKQRNDLEKRYSYVPDDISYDEILNLEDDSVVIITIDIRRVLNFSDQFYSKIHTLFYFTNAGTTKVIRNLENPNVLRRWLDLHRRKRLIILENPHLTSQWKNTIFFDRVMRYEHGIFDHFFLNKMMEGMEQINDNGKYFLYVNSNSWKETLSEEEIDSTNRLTDKEISKVLKKFKNKDVVVNSYSSNPALEYKGLIYFRHNDYCPRMVNEFLYYQKEILFVSSTSGAEYYFPNLKRRIPSIENPFKFKSKGEYKRFGLDSSWLFFDDYENPNSWSPRLLLPPGATVYKKETKDESTCLG